MVVSCSSHGCKNQRKRGSDIRFHRFPLNRPQVLAKWLHAMKRENFIPNKCSYLCSEHFKPDDYQDRPRSNIKLLFKTAVPSIFKYSPEQLKEIDQLRNLETLQINEINTLLQQIDQRNDKIKSMEDNIIILKKKLDEGSVKLKNIMRDLKTAERKNSKVLRQLKQKDTKTKSLEDNIIIPKKKLHKVTMKLRNKMESDDGRQGGSTNIKQ